MFGSNQVNQKCSPAVYAIYTNIEIGQEAKKKTDFGQQIPFLYIHNLYLNMKIAWKTKWTG